MPTGAPTLTMTVILQLNCNRSRGSHDMLEAIARAKRANVLLISEPNKALCRDDRATGII